MAVVEREDQIPAFLKSLGAITWTLQEYFPKDYFKRMGSKGGVATGQRKARTSEQARAAVNARWAKRKEAR